MPLTKTTLLQRTLTVDEQSILLTRLQNSVALLSRSTKPGNRFDVLTAEPSKQTRTINDVGFDRDIKVEADNSHLSPEDIDTINELPFIQGWIGAKGYDDELCVCGYYTWAYCYAHHEEKGYLVFSEECSEGTKSKVLSLIDNNEENYVKQDVSHTASHYDNLHYNDAPKEPLHPRFKSLNWSLSQTRSNYIQAFNALREYIHAGDCYQANLTQRFEADCELTKSQVVTIFYHEAALSGADYCALFELENGHYLASFSPENFIECANRQIKTKPIKGTVKRKGALSEAQQRELQNIKNRAENLMIVDLLRNDLSKVSKLDSVKVPKLFEIESYSNVHHLVSTISAELNAGVTEIDAFRSAFPGGSITGAPKKRAMEIIEELEVHPRRYYCGSIFYWDVRRQFDSNILIRTIEIKKNRAFCWAGGGIVADSDCDAEYQESLDKVQHITGTPNLQSVD